MPGRRRSSGQPVVKASDGLPALEVGSWTEEKLGVLRDYIYIFSTGMRRRWQNRVFVDLFSRPGLNVIEGPVRREIDGSPLVALKTKVPFTHYFFNELNSDFLDALKRRITAVVAGSQDVLSSICFTNLDCNKAARRISGRLNRLPNTPSTLCLVFVDPWRFELSFDALATLVRHRRADILVTFHTGSLKRNAARELEEVDKFIGDKGWRADFLNAPTGNKSRVVLNYFEEKLRSLGYKRCNVNDHILMRNSRGVPLYYLVFASKHPRGREFYDKVTVRLPSGQIQLPLDA